MATGEAVYDSNFWLCAATLDPEVRVQGQEYAYQEAVTAAVGGAASVIHTAATVTTDCQPNANIEALRLFLDRAQVEGRPLWKPMHCQPVFKNGSEEQFDERLGCRVFEGPKMAAYTLEVETDLFKRGFCLPAGPYVSDEDVHYIVDCIKEAIS